ATVAVHDDVAEGDSPGCGIGPQRIAVVTQGHAVAGPRAQRDGLGVRRALNDQGTLARVAGIGLDGNRYIEHVHILIRPVAGIILPPDGRGRGDSWVVIAATRIAVLNRGAAGAADVLVHDAVDVPVDCVTKHGARGQPAGGPEREGDGLIAGRVVR